MGIFVFAGFALIGLLSVGVQSNRDSKEQLQAANIIEFLCSTRRVVPTTSISAQPNFPLPDLSISANNFTLPIYLTWDGLETPGNTQAGAIFGLLYNITAPAPGTYTPKINPGFSTVYICIYWPAEAPLTSASGHVELTSTFALP